MEQPAKSAWRRSGQRLPLDLYLQHGARAGIAWTELKLYVLRLIWALEKPFGAYEVAARATRGGRRMHAGTVYRCLGCFQDAGLVVPIVTWKRYLLSPDPAVDWWGLLLCRGCGACSPFPLVDEREALDRALGIRGFAPRRYAAECEGRCNACREEAT